MSIGTSKSSILEFDENGNMHFGKILFRMSDILPNTRSSWGTSYLVFQDDYGRLRMAKAVGSLFGCQIYSR